MRTSNKNSSQFAHRLQNFTANNLHGINEGAYYVVYSYGWYPLFAYHYKTETWYENETKYSVSTSKQKTQVRPSFITKKMTHQQIKNLL